MSEQLATGAFERPEDCAASPLSTALGFDLLCLVGGESDTQDFGAPFGCGQRRSSCTGHDLTIAATESLRKGVDLTDLRGHNKDMNTADTAPQAAFGFTGHEIGKCRSCKTVICRETIWRSGSNVKCQCGQVVKLRAIFGNTSSKRCDARCTSATGPNCDCQCGGKNHGGDHR